MWIMDSSQSIPSRLLSLSLIALLSLEYSNSGPTFFPIHHIPEENLEPESHWEGSLLPHRKTRMNWHLSARDSSWTRNPRIVVSLEGFGWGWVSKRTCGCWMGITGIISHHIQLKGCLVEPLPRKHPTDVNPSIGILDIFQHQGQDSLARRPPEKLLWTLESSFSKLFPGVPIVGDDGDQSRGSGEEPFHGKVGREGGCWQGTIQEHTASHGSNHVRGRENPWSGSRHFQLHGRLIPPFSRRHPAQVFPSVGNLDVPQL